MGNARTRSEESVLQVMDGLAWLSQAGMFLVLGLLVKPAELWSMIVPASMIAGFLIFVARPAAVFLSLAPFGFAWREQCFIAWVGLRGAVPIVLALFPVMAGLPDALPLFDITFAVVCISLLLQGSTVPLLARWLDVQLPGRVLPLASHRVWAGEGEPLAMMAFRVQPGCLAEGQTLTIFAAIEGIQHSILLVRKGRRLMPEAGLMLCGGDDVWLLLQSERAEKVAQLFAHQEPQQLHASRRFFGQFVIDAEAPAVELARLYGLSLSDAELRGSVAQLMTGRWIRIRRRRD